jgi:hypothetical protein
MAWHGVTPPSFVITPTMASAISRCANELSQDPRDCPTRRAPRQKGFNLTSNVDSRGRRNWGRWADRGARGGDLVVRGEPHAPPKFGK